MQERPHVLHILGLLKDVLPSPSKQDMPPLRLPSYTTLILSHALRGIFYPSNFIYPMTARFLLQRPELDVSDVPMLYNMLYSSSGDWKKERGWIIRFLSDGMMSSEDWRVLKRRHTWDLLASLFQSTEHDRLLRKGIFEVRVLEALFEDVIHAEPGPRQPYMQRTSSNVIDSQVGTTFLDRDSDDHSMSGDRRRSVGQNPA